MAVVPPAPRTRRSTKPDTVLPDTAERQAQAALAALSAAEARRAPAEARRAPAERPQDERTARAARARQEGNERAKRRGEERKAAALRAANSATRASPAKDRHPEPEPAEPFDMGKTLKGMQIEHLQCRDFRHSWRPFSARWSPKDNCYISILRCGRCECERVRKIGPRGQLLGSTYDYPEGYVMTGAGRMSTSLNDQIRLASIQTVLIHDTVQE